MKISRPKWFLLFRQTTIAEASLHYLHGLRYPTTTSLLHFTFSHFSLVGYCRPSLPSTAALPTSFMVLGPFNNEADGLVSDQTSLYPMIWVGRSEHVLVPVPIGESESVETSVFDRFERICGGEEIHRQPGFTMSSYRGKHSDTRTRALRKHRR